MPISRAQRWSRTGLGQIDELGKQQFLLPVVLLPKWLTSGCSAVQIQLLALALHLFIVRMPGTIGKNGLVLSCYYCMKTKGQLSQLQSFCIKHCLHRAISLATDLFPLPEGRVLLVFRTKRGKLVVENRTPSWLELVQAGVAGKCLCTKPKGQGLAVLASHTLLSRGKG